MTVFDIAYVESFESGDARDGVEVPWTEGFWNGNYNDIYTVLDDEVVFGIQYPVGDNSSRHGISQLAKLFYDRFPQ